MKIKSNDPYELLAQAIVITAARDYRSAKKRLSRGRKNEMAEATLEKCLRFFYSSWFKTLTSIDPDFLVEKLDAEVGE
ncbi:hypothetical protein ACTQXK_00280 [Catenibacterium mitsuokai]|uniref:hypothetical protein n=1 Tax=Catenibacterium mitsuokai TaxID=100886 RepID=UPI003F920D01